MTDSIITVLPTYRDILLEIKLKILNNIILLIILI